ncbi:MAG: hypothetical protein HDR00_00585 [Lachnospiraceae bacterium]|nr:hypothetical protein [Lachnospiraceae bacterium]
MIALNENDYKYVIEDFSNYYIGARLSYQELVDNENTPGRLKDAVYRTFFKETAPSMTIGEHLLKLEDASVCRMAFSQLRIRIKVTALVQKEDKKGNLKETYETKDYSLDEFLKQEEIKENPEQYLVQEICFKKRHLMMMHV